MLTANHNHIHHKPNLNFFQSQTIGIPQVTQDQFNYILNDHMAGMADPDPDRSALPHRNI